MTGFGTAFVIIAASKFLFEIAASARLRLHEHRNRTYDHVHSSCNILTLERVADAFPSLVAVVYASTAVRPPLAAVTPHRQLARCSPTKWSGR